MVSTRWTIVGALVAALALAAPVLKPVSAQSADAATHKAWMNDASDAQENFRFALEDKDQKAGLEALTALFSGRFAPAQARLEEVSRLSSQPIGDTYLALAYYYTGAIERGRTMLEGLANSRSASTAARTHDGVFQAISASSSVSNVAPM